MKRKFVVIPLVILVTSLETAMTLGMAMSVPVQTWAAATSLKGGSRERQREFDGMDITLESTYYTMYQYESHANLKIRLDGSIEWDHGNPNLYSLFHERLIQNGASQEQMYLLEATASAHIICMSGRGRLYTLPVANTQSFRGRRLSLKKREMSPRIRHETQKRRRMNPFLLLPSDCLFKTYEFTPDESYERAVGIYSYPHSNGTHGRFLSRNPKNGKVRSYRRAFSTLYKYSQVKITQLPVVYLRDMILKTRFGREDNFNWRVRRCLFHLLSCPDQKEKLRRDGNKTTYLMPGGGERSGKVLRRKRRIHLYQIIERCKWRSQQTHTLPKCKAS